MDVATLSLKIALAIGAAYLTFAAVAVETRSPDLELPWWRRLNRYGLAALVTALLVFVAAVAVEVLNAKGDAEKAAQISALSKDLASSKAQTDTAVQMLIAAKREAALFAKVNEAMTVEVARGRYQFGSADPAVIAGPDSVKIANRATAGGFISVEGGDEVAWQLECPHGDSWRAEQPKECTDGVLGQFEGRDRYGFLVQVAQGRQAIPGEAASGVLIYRAPGAYCKSVLAALQEDRCALNIQHLRSGAKMARLEIERRNFGLVGKNGTEAVDVSDFCRHYELLHGKPCAVTP